MNHSLRRKSICILAFCFASSIAIAQHITEWDLDGDGVNNVADICPYVFGPASNKGCPDSSKKEVVKHLTKRDYLDSARAEFKRNWKNANNSMQEQNALNDFTTQVSHIAGNNDTLYAYAIVPLINSQSAYAFNQNYAERIALTFQRRSLFTYDKVIALLPAQTRDGIAQSKADEEKYKASLQMAKATKGAEDKAKDLAIANSPEEIAKRKKEEECAAAKARYNYKPGTTFTPPYKSGWEQQKLIITGPFDCVKGSFSGMLHYWLRTTKDKGYYVALKTTIKPDDLKYAEKIEGSYWVCATCEGKGIIEIKEQTQVQHIEGYKVEKGRLEAQKSQPTWTHFGRAVCGSCTGKGTVAFDGK